MHEPFPVCSSNAIGRRRSPGSPFGTARTGLSTPWPQSSRCRGGSLQNSACCRVEGNAEARREAWSMGQRRCLDRMPSARSSSTAEPMVVFGKRSSAHVQSPMWHDGLSLIAFLHLPASSTSNRACGTVPRARQFARGPHYLHPCCRRWRP